MVKFSKNYEKLKIGAWKVENLRKYGSTLRAAEPRMNFTGSYKKSILSAWGGELKCLVTYRNLGNYPPPPTHTVRRVPTCVSKCVCKL